MTVDWGEAGSDSGSPGGQGAPAQSGDATWLYAFFSDLLWSTEGGDFEPLVSADAIVGDDGLYLWQSPQLISDVTGWYGDPATNHGWLLRAEESALDTTAKRFNSREHPDQETWPRLIITFSPPPPLPVPALSALTLALLVFIVGWSGFWHRQRVTPQGKIGDQQF
ncbi:MAG: hypothetical protein GY934_04805 [Gammaproteobacteria bacterium]|nr:hypothetical protein [Gammaproteobacteria bacterium]